MGFLPTTMQADKAARIAKEVAAIMQSPAVRDKSINVKAEPISSTQQQTKDKLSKNQSAMATCHPTIRTEI
ncbi:MAG: hypothetical protein IPN04_09765 [Rhodoferax sp.]|nr:hypothetical protein [Rhodoferax sp.]